MNTINSTSQMSLIRQRYGTDTSRLCANRPLYLSSHSPPFPLFLLFFLSPPSFSFYFIISFPLPIILFLLLFPSVYFILPVSCFSLTHPFSYPYILCLLTSDLLHIFYLLPTPLFILLPSSSLYLFLYYYSLPDSFRLLSLACSFLHPFLPSVLTSLFPFTHTHSVLRPFPPLHNHSLHSLLYHSSQSL